MSRPLAHPEMGSVTVAGILYALSDPVRLSLVRQLLKSGRAMSCTEAMGKLAPAMPKSTCSQHYRILREAGLIVCERKGTELASRVRADELRAHFPGLLQAILKSYEKEVLRPPHRTVDTHSREGRGARPDR